MVKRDLATAEGYFDHLSITKRADGLIDLGFFCETQTLRLKGARWHILHTPGLLSRK